MTLITSSFSDSSQPELTQILNEIKQLLNGGLDDDNIKTNAAINTSKIDFGAWTPDDHSSQHTSTGTDPLPAGGITGAQIAAGSIHSGNYAGASILAEHLNPKAVKGGFYQDTSIQTVADGVVVPVPTGYVAEKTYCFIVGFVFSTTPYDRVRFPIELLCQAGQAAVCTAWGYDGGGGGNVEVTGSIKYMRFAFK